MGGGEGGAAGWVFHIPDCGVKLKGEDDVLVVADLADEATLGAQVTVVHMMGGKFDQGLEESFVHPLRDLWGQVQAFQAAVLRLWPSICTTWPAAVRGTLPEDSYPNRSVFPLGQEIPPESGRAMQTSSPRASWV